MSKYEFYLKLKEYKIISLVIIAIITISMFVIFVYSFFNLGGDRPTSLEYKTLNLRAREIINDDRNIRNVLSNVDKEDFSNYVVLENANFELTNADITKDGNASDNDSARNIGLNSSLVVGYNASLSLFGSQIETLGTGSNAIYVSGRGAYANINDTVIKANGTYSSPLVVNSNGYMKANHLTVYTKSFKSPGIDVVSKDATIEVASSLFETTSSLSPIINTSGKVSFDTSTGNAYGSPMAILENSGDVLIHESTIIATGGGVPDGFLQTGILIYGDGKSSEVQKFKSINSSLNIDKNYPYYNIASLFYIKDTIADINLTNNSLNFGSGVLAYLVDSDVTLYASNQHLDGNIIMNKNSNLQIDLRYGSSYDIALNNDNIKITLDSNSTLNLVGDTYIGEFENEDLLNNNINFNSYHLYVDGIERLKAS